ncbi:MAG: hypothetical protein U1B80_09225 [Anaerolineaceae bacterium]|nr:hypothetical protein [Anaerolineaceae bacterium]
MTDEKKLPVDKPARAPRTKNSETPPSVQPTIVAPRTPAAEPEKEAAAVPEWLEPIPPAPDVAATPGGELPPSEPIVAGKQPPPVPPAVAAGVKGRSKRWIIIVVVLAFFLLCCCCLLGAVYYLATSGTENIINELGLLSPTLIF